jgi:hypothetical protein
VSGFDVICESFLPQLSLGRLELLIRDLVVAFLEVQRKLNDLCIYFTFVLVDDIFLEVG